MELVALLKAAETASPTRRIEWRDRIAAYGVRGIEGVRPWLTHPVLAAFAVRVIERAGSNGEAAMATQVLRSARATVPPTVAGDVDWAVQRLRLRTRPVSPSAAAPIVSPTAKPVRQERPYLSAVTRRRAR